MKAFTSVPYLSVRTLLLVGYSFIQQLFTDHLLCAKHCPRHSKYSREQNGGGEGIPALLKLSFYRRDGHEVKGEGRSCSARSVNPGILAFTWVAMESRRRVWQFYLSFYKWQK